MRTKRPQRSVPSLLLALLFIPALFISCENNFLPGIVGEGDRVENTIIMDEFDGFVNTVAADIYLTYGDDQEVLIVGQQNIIDLIELDVRNGIWKIKYDQWVRRADPVEIFITIPKLTKIGITGSGNVETTNNFANHRDIEIDISGSGDIDLETDARDIDVSVSGSGYIDLYGTAKNLDVRISGSGDIRARQLETDKADIAISGSGDIYLNVRDYLNVTISGSGSVFYRGNPTIDSHISGSGTIIRD